MSRWSLYCYKKQWQAVVLVFSLLFWESSQLRDKAPQSCYYAPAARLLWGRSKYCWMLMVVPGQAVAWDTLWQADSFSLWVCVSCHLWRDMLVYLYSSYWISFDFLQFLHQIFFFHIWETGGGGRIHSKLAVVLPLKPSAVYMCLLPCIRSRCWWSLSNMQPEQL